ncbi:MAG TPA: protein translocase subunit SecD [Chthoniobacteraceae bacterium]|jgi:SecD/SecF fusion protein
MSPFGTFFTGLLLLSLFAWYFFTDSDRIKRILGTALTVLLVFLCLASVYPPKDKIQLGLDLQGGTSFLIRLIAEPDDKGERREITPTMVDQAVEVIRKRVDRMGTSEPVITPSGSDRILVQIPGLDTAKLDEARNQLKQVAKLEFKMVHPKSDLIVAGQEPPDPAYKLETYSFERKGKPVTEQLLVKKKADIPGDMVTAAFATFDQQGWGINMRFNTKGAELFGELSAANVGNRFAIVLDGVVQSAPEIREAMYGGTASITGSFSETEARTLASVLENPLATPVTIEEERSASASLGADSINSGVFAGLLGLALTVLCVLAYYRFSGLIANIALLINLILLFGAMGLFNTVLTLPGIAGIILTLGMAIDANVLIYERLREELAAGKSIEAAVKAAFDKAFSAIFDSNITTLITAVILFWKATGPVKGFAVTLTMGIIASLFTALVVTRNLFEWALKTGVMKKITMSNLIKATNFDFLGKRKAAITLSFLVIAGSVAIFAMRGERNFGVDFRGGDRLVMEATQSKPTENEVRQALTSAGFNDHVVQTERSANKEFLTIRSPIDTSERISSLLIDTFPQAAFKVEQSEKVGSLVGSELATNSLIALFLGMVGILIYVTLTFEFSFAVAAIVALLHDVIITIGCFALFGREFSLVIVGAILTIAGYSVNDTIVVFDRIREGIKNGRRGSVIEIMNLSINETLSRTILTGGTTLLTTLGLYLFGGPVLNDFAFAILIGVLVGTYSSIFIAAPIVLWWSGLGGRNLRTEIKRAEEDAAPAVV